MTYPTNSNSFLLKFLSVTALLAILMLPVKSGDCETLKALQCIHLEGKCAKEHVSKTGKRICLEYQHKYKCPVSGEFSQKAIKGLPNAYCITGDCLKTARSANGNMLDVLSKMEFLKQLGLQKQGDPVHIFKGDPEACVTNFGGSFKDCCNGAGGWGVSAKLGKQCSPQEEKLKASRDKGLCVFVGAHQKNSVCGINLSRQYTYCCFTSKLARIFQEQGRKQLGLNFGTAEKPDCRGLTLEEITRINLEQVNFQELFAEMAQSAAKATTQVKDFMVNKQKTFQQPKSITEQKQRQEDVLKKGIKRPSTLPTQVKSGEPHEIEY